MKKKTFKIKEIFILHEEIKTILAQKNSILTRYKMLELKKNVDNLLTIPNETKDELVKKYGEADKEGQVSLTVHLDEEKKVINPKFEKFIKDWTTILDQTKELKYTPIDIKLIENVETEQDIELIFQLLD